MAAFDDEQIDDPNVQRVRERTSFGVDPSLEYDSNASTVTLSTTTGTEYERTQERPPGTNAEPLSLEELREKYRMCGDRVSGFDAVEPTLESLTSLRDVSDAAELLAKF